MKFVEPRPYADPEAAACKLLEIANATEAVQDGRIHIERINGPFMYEHKGSPAKALVLYPGAVRALKGGEDQVEMRRDGRSSACSSMSAPMPSWPPAGGAPQSATYRRAGMRKEPYAPFSPTTTPRRHSGP